MLVSCEICGEEFAPRPNVAGRARFCSKPCRSKASQARTRKFHKENPGASMLYKSRSTPEAKERNRKSQRENHIKTRFGIPPTEYDAWMERAGHVCQLCGSSEGLGLDHDHLTGRIRGVLCRQHNTALGNLGDSASSLWSAFRYLLGIPTRPDWDSYYMMMCDTVAIRSDCTRAKVGSILVDGNNRVLSMGYIGVSPGKPGCLEGNCPRGQLTLLQHPRGGSYDNCISTHSEANCLLFADKGSIPGSALYVNRQPCPDCHDLAVSLGVIRMLWPHGQWHVDMQATS